MPRPAQLDLPAPDPALEQAARELASLAPVPAQVGRVLCGTAGWTDPTLIACGSFYPSQIRSSAQRLAYYASQFPMVEVDSTYYAIPAPNVTRSWVERTPPEFVFDIKAYPILTGHPLDRARLPRDIVESLAAVKPEAKRLYPKDVPAEVRNELIGRFRLALEPLQEAGRLGCVMLQFPPWFTATRGNARQLEALPDALPGITLAVELRHPSWFERERRSRLFDLLRARQLAYVSVDEPDVHGGGVPPVFEVTRTDLAVLRFHGHNRAGWRQAASVHERFNYLYSPDEIRAFSKPVQAMADKAAKVHAVYNNCVRDYAQVNAKGLAAVLLPQASSES